MEEKEKDDLSDKLFDDARANRKFLEEEKRQFESNFLQVKIAFAAFAGIVLTIVFGDRNKFPHSFMVVLICITFLTFLILMIELWRELLERQKSIKRQNENVILAQINRIALSNKDRFSSYGKEAVKEILDRDKVATAMGKNIPLHTILETLSYNADWQFYFFLVWTVLILSLPALLFLYSMCI
jgi:hypothetical protein